MNPLRREEAVQAAPAILALGGGPRPSAAAEDAEQETEEPGLTPAVALPAAFCAVKQE